MFGIDSVKLLVVNEVIISVCFKLRMFGSALNKTAHVFRDNQSDVKNVSTPESVFSKNHNTINYYEVVKHPQQDSSFKNPRKKQEIQEQPWLIYFSCLVCS